MSKPLINRLVIIGVGLIGGSLAKAIRQANAANEIVGAGRDKDHLQTAVELGVIDHFETNFADAVRGADMVVLAVPVGSMEEVLFDIKDAIESNAVITDVGSTKQSVVNAVEKVFKGGYPRFVPAHPIAGTEKTGVEASFAGLFHNRRIILTPLAITAADAVEKVKAMWELAGAKVTELNVKQHDLVLAATSHLPHMLAFSLVDTLAKMDDKDQVFRFAAGGFRDFTRIASSDPQMWHDICVNNSDQLLDSIASFKEGLDELTKAIEENNSEVLLEIFTRAKQARDVFTEQSS